LKDETKFKAEKNTTVIDLATGTLYEGEFAIPDSVIERSSLILANILLDYVQKTDKPKKLTPKNVFKVLRQT
jgi:hypothetical protein